MNLQQLLALLLSGNTQMLGMNQQNNQNPLLQLLGGNQQQDPTQQLIAMLSGVTGQQQNSISPQLLQLLAAAGGQQQQQNGVSPQLLQLLAGMSGGQQQLQTGGLDMAKLQELLKAAGSQKKEQTLEEKLLEMLTGKKAESDDDDVLTRMLNNFNKQNEDKSTEADLTDAIKFGFEFDKFIEDNDEVLPSWFNIKEVKEDVEKWAKTPIERSQGLAAATVRAFFKDEKMLDLLEERDRNTVKEKIIKDGIKSHEIDRKLAWPLVERALFNKGKLVDQGGEVSGTKESKAMEEYGSIFEQGQVRNDAASVKAE